VTLMTLEKKKSPFISSFISSLVGRPAPFISTSHKFSQNRLGSIHNFPKPISLKDRSRHFSPHVLNFFWRRGVPGGRKARGYPPKTDLARFFCRLGFPW
jgi:hypothetical protein